MKNCGVDNVRNFAVAGHAGAGKTALCDLILYKSGAVPRLGKVSEKTSMSDYRPMEQEKGHSIFGTPLNCTWKGDNFFFIDTPGNADFVGESTSSLSVCDMSLIVINGASGIEFGTTRAWRTARQRNCPRMIFVNSLDRENADFFEVLKELQETYGKTVCVPLTLPIGKEADFSEVFHVLRGGDAPAEIADMVEEYKTLLMDTVAESDEELMMRYLEGEELCEDEVTKGLINAVTNGDLVPVFCGSVEKDLGVEKLMNGLVNLAPSPFCRKEIKFVDGSEVEVKEDGDAYGLVFKTVIDPFIGQMTVMRVMSGKFTSDSEVFNVSTGKKERIGALIALDGKEQEQIKEACPGDIVAIAKLADTHVNNTLSTKGDAKELEKIEFPNPNVSFAIYSNKRGEEDKIISGLQKLCEEDHTLRIERHPETSEMLFSGMGNQHIEIAIKRLVNSSKVDVDLRTPRVPYRETIQATGDQRYRHKKQSGGRGQFAEVSLRVEPLPDAEFEFANEVVGGNIPKNYIPAVEKGVVNTMTKGPLANCRVINVKATVYDGKYHPVDSSDMAFQIAGSYAFREAMKQASPIILEPIQKVKVMLPDAYMGDVSGDLNSRRGRILGMGAEDGLKVIEAEVPLAEMFSYSSQLKSLTHGRGSYDMEFVRYEAVPANVAKEIQEAAAKEREEE